MEIPTGFWLASLAFMLFVMLFFKYAVHVLSRDIFVTFFCWLVLLCDLAAVAVYSPNGRAMLSGYLLDGQGAVVIQAITWLFMSQLLFSVMILIQYWPNVIAEWIAEKRGQLAAWRKRRAEAKAQKEAEKAAAEGRPVPAKDEESSEEEEKTSDKTVPNKSRRDFIKGGLLIPFVAAGASCYATAFERDDTAVREIAVPVKNLPYNLYGFRMVQISDVHLGMFYSIEMFKNLLERAAEFDAQALLITGDVLDDKSLNEEAVELINEFVPKFPKGIFFCFGNHEHIRGIKKIRAILKKTKIKVLDNDSVLIERGERPLYFAGVDYPMARHAFDKQAQTYIDEAMQNVPENAVTVLLAHHPDFIDYGADYNATMVVCGHTHGGQIGFMGVPLVPPVFKYMRGKYKVGETFGYVHSGNGSWFPYRLGCPPEIACFVLCEEG